MKIQLLDEAKVWYRSATVWCLTFALFLMGLGEFLPQLADVIPKNIYDLLTAASVVAGLFVKFVRQQRMEEALQHKQEEEQSP